MAVSYRLSIVTIALFLTIRPQFAIESFRRYLQCESKKSPCRFLTIFSKWLGIFNVFLHTYYTFLSTLDDKFLFNYFQL